MKANLIIQIVGSPAGRTKFYARFLARSTQPKCGKCARYVRVYCINIIQGTKRIRGEKVLSNNVDNFKLKIIKLDLCDRISRHLAYQH